MFGIKRKEKIGKFDKEGNPIPYNIPNQGERRSSYSGYNIIPMFNGEIITLLEVFKHVENLEQRVKILEGKLIV